VGVLRWISECVYGSEPKYTKEPSIDDYIDVIVDQFNGYDKLTAWEISKPFCDVKLSNPCGIRNHPATHKFIYELIQALIQREIIESCPPGPFINGDILDEMFILTTKYNRVSKLNNILNGSD